MQPLDTVSDINLWIRDRDTNRREASEVKQRREQYLVSEWFTEGIEDMRDVVPSCILPEASQVFLVKYIATIKVFPECFYGDMLIYSAL